MASKSISKHISKQNPSSHFSTKPLTKSKNHQTSTPVSKLNHISSQDLITPVSELLKQKHQSSLAMPSPASTPGAEHMSDVSSCCSVDENESNQGTPPDSPASSSFTVPVSDLKQKYKLWSSIRSDYRYLMNDEIIDYRSTESDLSLESDDQSASVSEISFKDYLQHYKELNDWLESMRQRTQQQSDCRSEKYVNQTFHEDMLKHLTSLKHFKDYAKQLMHSYPRLKDDINQHLKEVNGKWEVLEKLLLPGAKQAGQANMLQDMELDLERLKHWVDEMNITRRNWRLRSNWTVENIDQQLASQMTLQNQIESRSNVVRSLLSLCERLTRNEGCTSDPARTVELQRQVTAIQKEFHMIWLHSLEWEMTLKDAKANGIHLYCSLEDDQWDRMKSSYQKKQQSELPTMQEDSSDFVNDDDSFYMHRSLGKVRSDDSNIEESFSERDEDDAGLFDEGRLLRSDRRSVSDPLLNIDQKVCEGNSDLSPVFADDNTMKDAIVPEADGLNVKSDKGFNREWSPGKLKRYGAIDLVAAFDDQKLEQPVDVGYASGSHSNEETDSSARQDAYALLPPQIRSLQRLDNAVKDTGKSHAVLEKNIIWTPNDSGKRIKVEGDRVESRQTVSEGRKTKSLPGSATSVRGLQNSSLTVEGRCGEGSLDDLGSIPETEDEMSIELPFDDVPVTQSCDQQVAVIGGSSEKKSSQKTTFRRSLYFADETSTSDLCNEAPLKMNVKKKLGPGRCSGNLSQMLMVKGRCAKEDAVDAMKTKKKPVVSKFSGSCYASSEGTESESELMNQVAQPENQQVKSGFRLKPRWGCSTSLRSSPVKDVDVGGGRSPQKRRRSESLENIVDDWCEAEQSRKWMSDSAIYLHLRENVSSSKIQKMSLSTSAPSNSGLLKAFSENSGFGDDVTKPAKKSKSHGKPKDAMKQAFLYDQMDQVVPDGVINAFQWQDDMLAGCDSLNSSFTELTADDSQMCSDFDKNTGEEMHWQEDGFCRDDIEKDEQDSFMSDDMEYQATFSSAGPRSGWLDSDSDLEDFQHVLQDSRKGLKFIESTILQDCCKNDICNQDPSAFNEPLATCNTNISCLQELINALRCKNKMDNEIRQVAEIVSRWQQLQNSLRVLQNEAQRSSELQMEVGGIRSELENMSSEIQFDKFDSISQLEEKLKVIKAVHYKLANKTKIRLDMLDVAWNKFEANLSNLDSQSLVLAEQTELLKRSFNILVKRCESDGQMLQSSLLSWYKFSETEQDLKHLLLQQQHPVTSSNAEANGAGDNIELQQINWAVLDEKLQQLSSIYLDFVTLCSESSRLALKEAVMVPSSQLQLLRRINEEKMIRLVQSKKPKKTMHKQAALADVSPLCQAKKESSVKKVSNGLISSENASSNAYHPVKYILPVALAFVLVGCLYGLLGDSWYELLGSLGLIINPNLQHVRGPPPS